MTNLQRDISIDLSRFIAAFAVVYIHSSALWNFDKFSLVQILNSLSRFALPTFFFLSGYSLTLADISKKRISSLKDFLKHRSRKILMPFILWAIIYEFELYLIYDLFKVQTQNEFAKFDIKSIIFVTISGNSKYHLYFILLLIQLYLVYWIFYNGKIYNKLSTLAVCFVITLGATLLVYTDSKSAFTTHYSILPWIFYFVFGMWLADRNYQGQIISKNYLILFGILPLIIGGCFVIFETYYSKFGIHNSRISVILYSFGYILTNHSYLNSITTSNAENLSLRIRKFLAFLGEKSFGVYLLHPLILDLIWFIENILNLTLNHSSTLCVLDITFLTVICSYFIIEFTNRYISKSRILW